MRLKAEIRPNHDGTEPYLTAVSGDVAPDKTTGIVRLYGAPGQGPERAAGAIVFEIARAAGVPPSELGDFLRSVAVEAHRISWSREYPREFEKLDKCKQG